MGRRRAGATRTVVLAVGLTTALAGCSRADDVLQVRATDPASSTTTSAAPSPTTSASRTSTVSSSATGSSSSTSTGSTTVSAPKTSAPTATATASSASPSTLPSITSSSRTSATATATVTASRPAEPQAATWPKPLGEPQQGQPAWAVYLAIGHGSTDPVVEKAVRQAAGVHYSAVIGDIACDVGAMEALKLDQFDLWTGATVYFRTQADARAFAASYTEAVTRPKGTVKVKIGCLD